MVLVRMGLGGGGLGVILLMLDEMVDWWVEGENTRSFLEVVCFDGRNLLQGLRVIISDCHFA